MRQFFVVFHRYIGLVMVLFLVVAGLTGTMLAFYDELETLLHPEAMVVPAPPTQAMLAPLVLAELVEKRYPNAVLNRIPLHQEAGKPMRFFLQPAAGVPADSLQNNEIFVNPYTGEVLAERKWGDISQGMINLMPFIYRLHFSLALDTIGRYVFGIIALLWTIDCFVGAFLTLPQRQKKPKHAPPSQLIHTTKAWLSRWKKSWHVRWGSGAYKINFDLHRAGGLWLWAMLFVFAWSSVAFNLTELYRPVMTYLFASQQTEYHLPPANPAPVKPQMDRPSALTLGRTLMQKAATEKKFNIHFEDRLMYVPNKNIYLYSVNSSLDVSEKTANTKVVFDAKSGHLLARYFPTGVASGNTMTEWLLALHTARVWGLTMQVFVCLMGVAVTGLSMTGVYIWWKKRKAKRVAKQQLSRQAIRHKPTAAV